MKIISTLLLTLAFSTAFAETATYKIERMHCGGCAKMIQDSVCKMDGVTTCKAKLTNAKKQTGELTITTADGTAIDFEKLKTLMGEAGDYTLTKTSK